jgi:hypothetical protein
VGRLAGAQQLVEAGPRGHFGRAVLARLQIGDFVAAAVRIEHDVEHAVFGAVLPKARRCLTADQLGCAQEGAQAGRAHADQLLGIVIDGRLRRLRRQGCQGFGLWRCRILGRCLWLSRFALGRGLRGDDLDHLAGFTARPGHPGGVRFAGIVAENRAAGRER